MVTIFSTATCYYCKLVKQFLTENNIPFEVKDVGVDEVAREDMIKRSGQVGVPVTDIKGQLVIGFDKARLKELLGLV